MNTTAPRRRGIQIPETAGQRRLNLARTACVILRLVVQFHPTSSIAARFPEVRLLPPKLNLGMPSVTPSCESRSKEKQAAENNANTLAEASIPVVETALGLTTFAESAPSIIDKAPHMDSPLDKIANSYEDQVISDLTSRSFKIAHVDWVYGAAEGTNLVTSEFPNDLYSVPYISEILSRFLYIRADVEYEVKLNSTAFHIGALAVSQYPSGSSVADYASDYKRRRNTRPDILHASEENSLKRELRRIFPTMWDQIHDAWGYEIGSVFIDVRDPLLSLKSSAPSPVTVCLYARFTNVKLAGYIGITAGLTSSKEKQLLRNKVKKALLQQKTEKFMKKGTKNPVAKEGEQKSERGVISGIAEAIGTLSPLLLASPVPELAPVAAGIGMTAPFFKSLGLCKPVSVDAIQPVSQDPYRDLVHAHGLSQTVKMTMHPEAQLGDTTLCNLKRHNIKEIITMPGFVHKVLFDATTPVETMVFHFPVLPTLCAGNAATYYPTHLAYLSQFFRRWSGGIKVRIEFTTSRFTTTRVRVFHLPNKEIPDSLSEDSGNFISKVFDVKGPTVIEYTLPHIMEIPKNPVRGYVNPSNTPSNVEAYITSGGYPLPYFGMYLETKVSVPEPTDISVIYCNMYISAAEDFILADFCGWTWRHPATLVVPPMSRARALLMDHKGKEKVREQTTKFSLKEAFSKPFPYLAPAKSQSEYGLTTVETVTTIEECLKRYMRWDGFTDAPMPQSFEAFSPEAFQVGPIDPTLVNLAEIFRFWRGSRRFKFGPSGITKKVNFAYDLDPATGLAQSNLNVIGDSEPPVEFELPWPKCHYAQTIHDEDFFFQYNDHDQVTFECVNKPTYMWQAVGEDFMFGEIIPPPKIEYFVPAPSPPPNLSKSDVARTSTPSSSGSTSTHVR